LRVVFTANDTLHVKLLTEWGWSDFLHEIEDIGPTWVRDALYGNLAQGVTTYDGLKRSW